MICAESKREFLFELLISAQTETWLGWWHPRVWKRIGLMHDTQCVLHACNGEPLGRLSNQVSAPYPGRQGTTTACLFRAYIVRCFIALNSLIREWPCSGVRLVPRSTQRWRYAPLLECTLCVWPSKRTPHSGIHTLPSTPLFLLHAHRSKKAILISAWIVPGKRLDSVVRA